MHVPSRKLRAQGALAMFNREMSYVIMALSIMRGTLLEWKILTRHPKDQEIIWNRLERAMDVCPLVRVSACACVLLRWMYIV